MDLPDPAERLQMESKLGAAHRDPDPPAPPRQGAHHMPADKTRTAKYRHKPVCPEYSSVIAARLRCKFAGPVLERFRGQGNRESNLILFCTLTRSDRLMTSSIALPPVFIKRLQHRA